MRKLAFLNKRIKKQETAKWTFGMFASTLPGWLAIPVVLMFLTGVASATVLSNWPDWEDSKRILKVYVGNNGTFTPAVQSAITTWNTANSGNSWNFVVTTDAGAADITISEKNPGGTKTGSATAKINATGLFGWGSGEIDSIDVAVKPGLSIPERDRTIIHELGHGLRLNHTPGSTDVMNKSNTATTPSTEDIDEALSSDKDPPCPLAVSSYLKVGEMTTISLIPKPGSGIDFSGVHNVTITSLTGPDFVVDEVLWDDSSISVVFDVELTATHNEVFNARLEYMEGGFADYTGVLTITEDDAPIGMFPHAVAGEDVIVELGDPVLLDGRGSFHDDSSVFFSGTWLTDGGLGLFDDYGELVFSEVGTYTAALQIADYYGRTSIDTITVTVIPEPTTVLLLGLGGLALLRKRRA